MDKKFWVAGLLICGTFLFQGCDIKEASSEASFEESGTLPETTSLGEDEVSPQTSSLEKDENMPEASSLAESSSEKTEKTDVSDITQDSWRPDSLKVRASTVISCNDSYNTNIKSSEDAYQALVKYGKMQKDKYDNPEVSLLEKTLEEEFDIAYVCLGEMDIETARDVYDACEYMFTAYPQLKGTLTDLTLGNIEDGIAINAIALTRDFEFMNYNKECPMVIKREVILDAATFLNRDKLLDNCRYQEECGHWPHNSSISMIVVHELAHHLLSEATGLRYGFYGCYVTENNFDIYCSYRSDSLASSQITAIEVVRGAYELWSINHQGSEEDFRNSISEYAGGIQRDGGVSYTETFAEAIADIYANGDEASEASKLIAEQLERIPVAERREP